MRGYLSLGLLFLCALVTGCAGMNVNDVASLALKSYETKARVDSLKNGTGTNQAVGSKSSRELDIEQGNKYDEYVIGMEKVNLEREKAGLKLRPILAFKEWADSRGTKTSSVAEYVAPARQAAKNETVSNEMSEPVVGYWSVPLRLSGVMNVEAGPNKARNLLGGGGSIGMRFGSASLGFGADIDGSSYTQTQQVYSINPMTLTLTEIGQISIVRTEITLDALLLIGKPAGLGGPFLEVGPCFAFVSSGTSVAGSFGVISSGNSNPYGAVLNIGYGFPMRSGGFELQAGVKYLTNSVVSAGTLVRFGIGYAFGGRR